MSKRKRYELVVRIPVGSSAKRMREVEYDLWEHLSECDQGFFGNAKMSIREVKP